MQTFEVQVTQTCECLDPQEMAILKNALHHQQLLTRHARVIPAPYEASIHDLGELALGKQGADEIEAGKSPIVDAAQFESLDEP